MRPDLEAAVRRWDTAVCDEARRHGRAPRSVERAGSALRVPAGPAQIAALERRLGTALPPSFAAFLHLSDGAYAQPMWGVTDEDPATGTPALGLLGCHEIRWLRDRDRATVDIWWGTADEPPCRGHPHPAFCSELPETLYLAQTAEYESMKAGHMLYALQVGGEIDGYTILLNPLVVDRDGEWEAWDFGPKNPGAIRYRSFAEMLAAAAAEIEQDTTGEPARQRDVDELAARAADGARATDERLGACLKLMHHRAPERALPVLLDLTAPERGDEVRAPAAAMLGRLPDARATRRVLEIAREPGVSDDLLHAIVGPLAGSGDAEAQAAAVAILSRPATPGDVIGSIWYAGRDALWEAWLQTPNPHLLVQLASCGDPRACEPLARVIVDETQPAEVREKLVRVAAQAGDASVIPAL